MKNDDLYLSKEIVTFYTDHLKNFGDTAKGVGWKDEAAQFTRFDQLAKIIRQKDGFTINDLGCGTAKFHHYLVANNYHFSIYKGYDILEEMITAASEAAKGTAVKLKKINDATDMELADYTVASGIFNVKYAADDAGWTDHVVNVIRTMNEKSTRGFAFNCLTKYSDKEYMQQYLYYADPLFLFDYCKKNFSKSVALLHDYDPYDFTILVRK